MNTLYAVGVGPGDPELLTLKAHRVLQQAAVIFVPKANEQDKSVALDIAKQFIPPDTEIVFLHMPMLNSRRQLQGYWQDGARQVIDALAVGDAAFLTIGDPLTYSTAAYLVDTVLELVPETPVQFIPGITSFSACAAQVGVPLVEGNETLLVVPSAGTKEYFKTVLTNHDNCILMKVSRCFDTILQVLEELQLKEKAVFVSRCGTHRQQIIKDLDNLRGTDIDYLSLLIVKSGQGGK